MSLKSSNKVETNIWELEIAIDGATFEAAVAKAYLSQRKKIAIPGFRKGKAPRSFIEKLYGEGTFYEDALEIVYPDAVEAAITESGLNVVDVPFDLKVPKMEKDGVEITLKVTVKPEVTLGEYKGLKATKKATKVSADEVKAEMTKMQEQNSRMVTVDRAAKKNDITVLDFEGFVDGKAFEGGKAENFELTIGSGQFIPGFEEQIIGHKAEEEFDVNVKFPDEYQADLASKDAVFKIKLHEIKIKELPAIDDEFVKEVSEFDTVDEWKKSIKADLEKAKENSAKIETENALLDMVADGIKAEIPACMIEKTVDGNIEDFSYRLQSQGIDMDMYLQYTGMDMNAFREGFKEKAEMQVKLNLALEKIAEVEKIEVSDEDIDAEYEKYAKAYNMEIDAIKKAIPADSMKPELASKKAVDLITSSAVITEEKAAKKTVKKEDDANDSEKKAVKKPAAKKPAAKKAAKEDAE
ncbi:MAG: trigger factor [Oscillospiraceae bacterium]